MPAGESAVAMAAIVSPVYTLLPPLESSELFPAPDHPDRKIISLPYPVVLKYHKI